jgi:hypothetical protein
MLPSAYSTLGLTRDQVHHPRDRLALVRGDARESGCRRIKERRRGTSALRSKQMESPAPGPYNSAKPIGTLLFRPHVSNFCPAWTMPW